MKLSDRRLLELLDRRNLGDLDIHGRMVLVAVSGGADSVALLRALRIYAPLQKVQLAAVHVNHGIRPESAAEAAFVEELCRVVNVPLFMHTLKLENRPKGMSPEEFWRHERYQAFMHSMVESNADYVALGHNADDLAESFLYHLARGTGPEGLTFHFVSHGIEGSFPIIRPLWKTRRAKIEKALSEAQQEWINDPSNLNLQFSRNRIRKEVIPALEIINPEAVTAIIKLADKLTEYVNSEKQQGEVQSSRLEIDQAMRESPYNVLCGAIRDFLSTNADISHTSRHVEQAADMVRANSSGIVALPNSWNLVVTQEFVWAYQGVDPTDQDLAREHCIRFGGFAADLSGSMSDSATRDWEVTACDGARYTIQLTGDERYIIRNRRTGDRVGPKTLKKLLIEHKIPWYLRDYLVLAASSEGQVADILTDHQALRDWTVKHATDTATLASSKVPSSA